MDTSAVVKIINDAAASHSSAEQSEKAQLIAACTNMISSLEAPDQKLMALLFDVSDNPTSD